MSRIKVMTLTPVHVGSGEQLQYLSDFVTYGSHVYVIDPRKVLDLIGVDNLQSWVALIEQEGDILHFVQTKGGRKNPDDFCLRRMQNRVGTFARNDKMREQMHDGMGVPYIPGSSLKGAIRSSALEFFFDYDDFKRYDEQFENGTLKNFAKKASEVESYYFGKNPNDDVFRFVQVGDCFFEKGCEEVIRLINLNIRHSFNNLVDKSKSQPVEVIGKGCVGHLDLKIAKEAYQFSKRKLQEDADAFGHAKMLDEAPSLYELFQMINFHTDALLEEEIDYWKKQEARGKNGSADYINQLTELREEIAACAKGRECVIRVGHASGWRFITGAWSENFDCFADAVVPVARRKNDDYSEYDFPKSRRVAENVQAIGFIKMSAE